MSSDSGMTHISVHVSRVRVVATLGRVPSERAGASKNDVAGNLHSKRQKVKRREKRGAAGRGAGMKERKVGGTRGMQNTGKYLSENKRRATCGALSRSVIGRAK